MNIILSGASGFIGNHLASYLNKIDGINLICLCRKPLENKIHQLSFDDFFSGNLTKEVDYFIHLASPNYDYCNDNSLREGIVGLTEDIVNKLDYYKCRKFIYFSSCKVYGESSSKSIVFDENSELNPISDYAIAKATAEFSIREMSKKLQFNYLIYRLPFVFGEGMKSNLGALLGLIDKSLPIVSFKNGAGLKKSFVSIENILKVLDYNINNPLSVDNNIFNIADLNPISMDEFLSDYKKQAQSKSLLIKMPKFIFSFLAKLPIVKNIVIKIFGDFQIENIKIRRAIKEDLLTTSKGISNLLKL